MCEKNMIIFVILGHNQQFTVVLMLYYILFCTWLGGDLPQIEQVCVVAREVHPGDLRASFDIQPTVHV